MTSNTAVESTTTAQILSFPHKEGHVAGPGEIMNNLMQMKILSVEDALQFLVPVLFEAIDTAGFSLNDDRLNATLVTLLRGMLYNHFHIDHPLIEFINKNDKLFDQMIEDQITLSDLMDDEFEED